MGKYYGIVPETSYGWAGLTLGLGGVLLWGTQMIWNWFGITEGDKALFSLLTVIILLFAVGCYRVAQTKLRSGIKHKRGEGAIIFRTVLIGLVAIILIVIVINGFSMTLDVNYESYANNNFGFFTGLKLLTSVTAEDVNSLQNWALGVRQIVRAMFLTVPVLIATWGGLSVLTADSIDEAEGGILAVVAAFIVFLIVWIFKAIDVSLMSMLVL